MITNRRAQLESALQLFAAGLQRLGFTPNGVTALAALIGVLNALLFVYTERPLLFVAIAFFTMPLDALDGALARRTGSSSRLGAYLDAMADRLVDCAGALAAAIVTGHWVLCMVGILGADAISYAKARAAMEVPIDNRGWPELMQRTERALAAALALVLWGLFPEVRWLGHDLFVWVVGLLNVLIAITLVQRVWRASEILRRAELSA